MLFTPQSLLEAHDMVASKSYEAPPSNSEVINDVIVSNALMHADSVRIIGIQKKTGEPLVSYGGGVMGSGHGYRVCHRDLTSCASQIPYVKPSGVLDQWP